jgi:hypothetical protein
VAALLHGVIPVVALWVGPPKGPGLELQPTQADIEIEIEPHDPIPLPKPPEPEPLAAVDPRQIREAPTERQPIRDPRIEPPRGPEDPYAPTNPTPEAPVPTPAPTSSGQVPKDEYDPLLPDTGGGVLTGPPGLGRRPVWTIPGVLPESGRPPPAPTTPGAPREVDKNIAGKVLNDELRARDKGLGIDLPAAGTVATAIGNAVRGGDTPSEGRATFVVRLSPTGEVLDVRLASSSAGSQDVWQRAAQAAAARLRGKSLTMTGAYKAGATVYVDVTSAVLLPDGTKGGVKRQGTGVGFDVSNLGANPSRVVKTSFRVVPAK